MSLGLVFWVLMLLWLVLWFYPQYPAPNWPVVGGGVLLFILLLILGWHDFGPPIRA